MITGFIISILTHVLTAAVAAAVSWRVCKIFRPQFVLGGSGNTYTGVITELRRTALIIGACMLRRDAGMSADCATTMAREIAKDLDAKEQHYRIKFEERPMQDTKARRFECDDTGPQTREYWVNKLSPLEPHEFQQRTGVFPACAVTGCGRVASDDVHNVGKTETRVPDSMLLKECLVCHCSDLTITAMVTDPVTFDYDCTKCSHSFRVATGGPVCPECGCMTATTKATGTFECLNCHYKSGQS